MVENICYIIKNVLEVKKGSKNGDILRNNNKCCYEELIKAERKPWLLRESSSHGFFFSISVMV